MWQACLTWRARSFSRSVSLFCSFLFFIFFFLSIWTYPACLLSLCLFLWPRACVLNQSGYREVTDKCQSGFVYINNIQCIVCKRFPCLWSPARLNPVIRQTMQILLLKPESASVRVFIIPRGQGRAIKGDVFINMCLSAYANCVMMLDKHHC